MSEIPAKPSTTKESGNNTQSSIISIPDFNFSINCQVNVNFDPETKALLKTALRLLEAQKQDSNVPLAPEGESVTCSVDLPTDEPTELRPDIPDELIAPEKLENNFLRIQVEEDRCVVGA